MLRAIIFLIVLTLSCKEVVQDEFLGCVTVDNREVCVYCDENGVVEVTGNQFGNLFILCEDWCNYTEIGKLIEGCNQYLDTRRETNKKQR